MTAKCWLNDFGDLVDLHGEVVVMPELLRYVWVSWLIDMRDMTHLCVRHDSFICETYLIRTRDMTHSCMRHDWFMCVYGNFIVMWQRRRYVCVPQLIHVWDMTHSLVRNDSSVCETLLIHAWDVTHSYMRHDSFKCVCGKVVVTHDKKLIPQRDEWPD